MTEPFPVRACVEDVPEPPGYWHSHRCGRKAKWLVAYNDDRPERPVCGIHVKWYEKHGRVLREIPA